MYLAAAYALAGIVTGGQLTAENIIPSVFNDDVAPAVAKAVREAAIHTGVSRKLADNDTNARIFNNDNINP